jgi:hypothetical protein
MKTECRQIAVGLSVGEGVKAPKDTDAMFSVVSTERTFYLVADSASEARLVFFLCLSNSSVIDKP